MSSPEQAAREREVELYLERRKLVFCAAFGAAHAQLTLNYPANGKQPKEIQRHALKAAQDAAAALPAPGEPL